LPLFAVQFVFGVIHQCVPCLKFFNILQELLGQFAWYLRLTKKHLQFNLNISTFIEHLLQAE
jgi:hypothetical protein